MKKMILVLVLLVIPILKTNASDVFVNSNGVAIPIEKYVYLQNYYHDEKINSLTQEQYDHLKDKELRSVAKEDHYYITTTHKDSKGIVSLSTTSEVTKEEYEQQSMIAPAAACGEGDVCWETSSKRIALDFVCDELIAYATEKCGFSMYVHWNKLPSTRSYDILAFRWSEDFEMETYSGTQDGHIDGIAQRTEYNQGGNNSKTATNGVGISMNLYDDSTTLYLTADVDGILYNYAAINLYATYQHATSSLTLANSKSYTFSASGLGEVLYFSNSTIRNKYDNMQGIKLENYGEV